MNRPFLLFARALVCRGSARGTGRAHLEIDLTLEEFMSWDSRYRPEERYEIDPVFHQLVDYVSHMLEENAMRNWTPTELREAVMLACAKYEYRHVRPIMVAQGDTRYDSIIQRPIGMTAQDWKERHKP